MKKEPRRLAWLFLAVSPRVVLVGRSPTLSRVGFHRRNGGVLRGVDTGVLGQRRTGQPSARWQADASDAPAARHIGGSESGRGVSPPGVLTVLTHHPLDEGAMVGQVAEGVLRHLLDRRELAPRFVHLWVGVAHRF